MVKYEALIDPKRIAMRWETCFNTERFFNDVVQCLSLKVDSCSGGQEIPRSYATEGVSPCSQKLAIGP